MKLNTLFFTLSLGFFTTFQLQSQNEDVKTNFTCGTAMPSQQWENELSQLIQTYKQNQSANKQQSIYTIPVIIHVIHGGQAVGTYPNLANGQLVSQIQALNNDYGGIGYNSSVYPLSAFTNYAFNNAIPSANLDLINRVKIANCNIQFCLATKDTLGNVLPEPGIERISYVSRGWNNPATITGATNFQNYINNTIKPQTIWNVSKYLNIWVTDENINANSLLGYATFPVLSTLTGFGSLTNFLGTSTSDGFWCYARAFGSSAFYPSGTYYQNYTFGRTCTHEIGHWLGLRHIWGDANCGTDYCDDTPPARASNFNSIFTYPYKVGTCNGNSPDGEMPMNFMDYTNDNAKYMFTTDQATRMQVAMQNSPYRKFLGSHNLCSVSEIAATAKFNSGLTVCEGAALTLSNQSLGTPVPNFTWSSAAGAVFFPNNNTAYTVTFPSAGIYTISLTANNGTTSVFSKTVNVLPAPSLSLIPNRTNFCLNENVTLQLAGGDIYVWQPDSIVTDYISLPSSQPAEYSYTCFVTGTNTCKTSTVVNVKIQDCTGILLSQLLNEDYSIYPNPANDHLTIESTQLFDEQVRIEIYDALGRIQLSFVPTAQQKSSRINLSVSSLEKGMYFVKINHHQKLIVNQKLLIN